MTDQKTIDSLKHLIRKQIAEASEGVESPKSMHEMGVALGKAASASLKALEGLKQKAQMPSRKASAAISMHLNALEGLFNDMWQSPLSYLDSTPEEVVANRRADLDGRGPPSSKPSSGGHDSALIDHTVQETAEQAAKNTGTERVLSDPTHCPVCGCNYDKKVSLCPMCAKAKGEPKMMVTTESTEMWANKLRSSKS